MDACAEGDHIKVTASKYPFPTVCADKQSTDWFHAISRTLKWNERERQKSFVVVEEEGPPKPVKRRKRSGTFSDPKSRNPQMVEESPDEEEDLSDEEEDDDEEEDKYDIDDSSPEAEVETIVSPNGQEKTPEKHSPLRPQPSPIHKRKSKSRSRSRPPSSYSGVDSPSRFVSPAPHPPDVSPRHVGFQLSGPRNSVSSSPDSLVHAAQQGTRDDLHGPRPSSARSRIPKDRDLDFESAKTPTANSLVHGRGRGDSRSRSSETHEHRAFAVWGHDESDSNASDSES